MIAPSIFRTLLAVVAWSVLHLNEGIASDRPNVILILADDLGWTDTTLYGKTELYETPNLERLAARGMTFNNAYSSHPLCSPTRSSILSGQNPARTGFTTPGGHTKEVRYEPTAKTSGPPQQKSNVVQSSTRLDPAMPTLATVLKVAGYATAHFGKWHLGDGPHSALEFGFDIDIPNYNGPGPGRTYLAPWTIPSLEGEPGEHIEDRMAEEAANWLKNRDRSKPFFMNYWQFSVHAPFGAKPELIDRYRSKIDRISTQQSPTYAAMLHSMDDAIGTLLDALDEEGIADETIILFTSDNGGNQHCGLEETDVNGETYITPVTSNAPLLGGKGNIHDGGIRVPGIVVWPGVTEAGSRNDTRIQSTDLYPTILRMLKINPPANHPIDGVDFSTALKGEELEREPMFTYVPSYGNTPKWLPPSMAVHHGKWKLIRIFHHGENGAHQFRLYDLENDIGETRNLAAEQPETVQRLDALIDDFIVEAEVVVPTANPNFDLAQFDASKIGVQAGGLKMPPAAKTPGQPALMTMVKDPALQGWIARNAEITSDSKRIIIKSLGRHSFLATTQVRSEGTTEVNLKIRGDGEGSLQWRTEDQEEFLKTQSEVFTVKGNEWTTITVTLPVEGTLVQLRVFPPSQSQKSTGLSSIEVTSTVTGKKQRWDFKSEEPAAPEKAKRSAPKASPQAKLAKRAKPTGNETNIILILADDLGYGELGCYGSSDAKTPSMDRLAAEGVRFTDGYSAFPVCSPSRAAILTGRYPHRFGDTYEDYYGGGSPNLTPEDHPTIGQLLQGVGYETFCFGKWNVSNLERRRANDFGFDSWVGLHLNHDFYTHRLIRGGELDMYKDGEPYPDRVGTWCDTVFADEALKVIEAQNQKPFFIFLPFQAPHTPIQDPDVPMDKPQEKNRPTLIKMIERLDLEVGRVLQALEDQNLADNTLVILTSDNGGEQAVARNLPLGGAKQSLNEGGVRVPYILRWPGVLPEGKVCETPVTAYDLTATIAAAGGAAAYPGKPFDGVDLIPALNGTEELSSDRPLFFRRRNITVHRGENSIRQSAVRRGDWKYLRTYKPVGSNRYQQALYDLKDDIAEENNLAESNPEMLKTLSELLEQWEEEVDATGLAFEDVPRPQKGAK
jgi:arylsulfatase A-like enzyme